MTTRAPSRPLILYFGSKWRIAPWVISHFPAHRVYVEAYGGSGSILLRKPRAKVEVYNDLKSDLVNLFRVLREPEQAARLLAQLRLTPYAYEEWLLAAGESADPVEAARRLIVRAYMTVGSDSLQRTRGGGFRNYWGEKSHTPPCHQWAGLPDAIKSVPARVQGIIIENRDAVAVMQEYDSPQTLHYVDPPYVRSTRGRGWNRYVHDLNDDDHRALAKVLHALTGMVILSGYPSPLYADLYGDWQQVQRSARSTMGAKRTEVLWISPRAVTRPQLALQEMEGIA